MDTNPTPETLLARRDVLRTGALGVASLGLLGGLSNLAQAFEPAEPLVAGAQGALTTANDAAEYQRKLLTLGSLALRSAQFGQKKATDGDAKNLANFEAAEQKAFGKVLKEMGAKPLPLPAMATDIVAQHQNTTGAEFDKVFARTQLLGHQMLLDLNRNYLSNSRGRGMAEMHARHLATVAIPAITEHIAHAKALVAKLGA